MVNEKWLFPLVSLHPRTLLAGGGMGAGLAAAVARRLLALASGGLAPPATGWGVSTGDAGLCAVLCGRVRGLGA